MDTILIDVDTFEENLYRMKLCRLYNVYGEHIKHI